MANESSDNQWRTGGGAMFVLGIVFSTIGASGNTTFLWIGIPFLVSGLVGVAYSVLGKKTS